MNKYKLDSSANTLIEIAFFEPMRPSLPSHESHHFLFSWINCNDWTNSPTTTLGMRAKLGKRTVCLDVYFCFLNSEEF